MAAGDFDEGFETWQHWSDYWSRHRSKGSQHLGDSFLVAWDDIAFRVMVGPKGCWLHLYHCGIPKVPFAQLHLGDADWAFGTHDWQAREVYMAIRRRQGNGGGQPGKWMGDAETAAAYPQLCEFLTADEYEGGGKRTRGTLTLMSIDRSWRAVLNDKDTNESLWAAADTLAGLLDAIELELLADEPNWRAKPGTRPGKK